MRLIVTGATSFLGSALVRRLLQEGHEVYAVIRPGSANRPALIRAAEGAGGTLHVVERELAQLDRLDEAVPAPCPLYVHLGWDGSGSDGRKKEEVQEKNAEYGLLALEGARKLGCRRFLFCGSQAEYGPCRERTAEDHPCHPVSPYGKAKLRFGTEARRRCRLWKEQGLADMEYIHLRVFSVYGPGDHPWSLVSSCLRTFAAGGVMELGACTQQWNFLYVDDWTEAVLALAFARGPLAEDGVYNVAGEEGETRPLREYVEEMRRLCGGRGVCVYGKLPPNAEGPASLMPDTGKIRRDTGWRPRVSFEEGIRTMQNRTQEEREPAGMTGNQPARRCLVCGAPLPERPLLELSGMPASAQNIPSAQEVREDRGISLRLCRCGRCGLVQFDCPPVDYYRDVIRSGGYSTTMARLRREQYRRFLQTCGLEGKKILEVGCGQGEFLKVLTEFPVQAYGVEHRKDLVQKAAAAGLSVWEGFTETPDTVLGSEGPYDGFLSFNFLEHQPEPGVMLDCIRRNLTEAGAGLITVPSLEYILKYDGYYELIRDHLAYYTFDTLRYLLERHGFQVLEEEMVNRDTLSVIVKKGPMPAEPPEPGPLPPLNTAGLQASLADIRGQMEHLAGELARTGQTFAVWGAGHQGFTLAATTCLGQTARYIIDSAPFKQGRYAPASHLPIVSPEQALADPPDAILIAAPGYTEEIADEIRRRFPASVRILALRSDHLEELAGKRPQFDETKG